MDTARHVIETFFKTTLNPMTRHHLDSFNDFLDTKLPRFIQASNPLKLLLEDDRSIYIYIGGKDGTKLKYKVLSIIRSAYFGVNAWTSFNMIWDALYPV